MAGDILSKVSKILSQLNRESSIRRGRNTDHEVLEYNRNYNGGCNMSQRTAR